MSSSPPLDPEQMLRAVASLPEQIEAAWRLKPSLIWPARDSFPVDAVVLAGMGGSAIAGDLAAAATAQHLARPMTVVRDYALPGWVNAQTLVIASSFSGNTEETLCAFEAALRASARVVVITSGGQLAERAQAEGLPVIWLPPQGTPRAAVGASLAAVLHVLYGAGLVPDPSTSLRGATWLMRELVSRCGPDVPGGGVAGELAAQLVGKVVIVYAPEYLAAAARRWKTQLNENAKSYAGWDTLPELNHNTIVGYAHPPALPAQSHIVVLTGPFTSDRLRQRIQATVDLLSQAHFECTLLAAPGDDALAEALWHVQFADLVSVYLAYQYGVDPTPVPAIQRLKAQLAASTADPANVGDVGANLS